MPTSTFFNLPEEKKSRLLKAASDEFSRVPLNAASINRIVKNAGIPRGSFYMYFQDKQDLFSYLLLDYQQILFDITRKTLMENAGDVFKAYFTVIDYILEKYAQLENQSLLKNVAVYFLNNLSGPDILPFSITELTSVVGGLGKSADLSGFRLKGGDDIADYAAILAAITRDAFAELFIGAITLPEFKQNLRRRIDILKYGMLEHSCGR